MLFFKKTGSVSNSQTHGVLSKGFEDSYLTLTGFWGTWRQFFFFLNVAVVFSSLLFLFCCKMKSLLTSSCGPGLGSLWTTSCPQATGLTTFL